MILLVGTFGNALATTVGNVGSGENTMASPIPHPDGPIEPDDIGAAHFTIHTVDVCPTDVANCPPLMKTVNPFPPEQTNPILSSVHEEFIPIDATAVLIAGAQSNALSILTGLMVIGAIAFGALYVSVKRKHN